jgi:hypothetical protein
MMDAHAHTLPTDISICSINVPKKMTTFWDVVPYSLFKVERRYRGCEISSSHGGEYDVQYNPEDSSERYRGSYCIIRAMNRTMDETSV